MKKSVWRILFQITIVALGVSMGIYFSMKSDQVHKNGHEGQELHTTMAHGYIDISNDHIIPEIEKVEVTKDAMSGWNLYIATKNFQFTPENASSKHIPGEGHAHLMINGNKTARIYSNWFHISETGFAIKEIEITLNANSHAVMSVNEKPISIKLNNLESEKLLPTK